MKLYLQETISKGLLLYQSSHLSHLRIMTLITKQSGHHFLCIRINAPQVFWLVDKV